MKTNVASPTKLNISMKTPVIVIDACQYSPNYNNCLLDALVKRGEKVVYATTVFPHAESPIPPGIEVRYCFFYLARMLGRITSSNFPRRVLRAIEYPVDLLVLIAYILLKRIKLVHYMWVVLPTIDLFIIRILRYFDCRVVYTAHNPFPHDFKASHLKKYSRIHRQVDHIIALTDFTRNEIVKRAKIPADKISVIVHGDLDYVLGQYATNEVLVDKVRQQAGGRHVISFLGLIRPYKGLDYFVKAFQLIKRQQPNTFFLIGGSTRFAEQRQLEELISQYCHPKDCYVDLRYLPISDIKAYLSVTDVLVQPYISASQSGNTIMAYSAGIPVVCTDVGGLAEMVENGRTGYIIPLQDPQAIADAVVKCLQGDNLATMSAIARSWAAERYNWRTIAAQTAQVYHQLDEMTKKS